MPPNRTLKNGCNGRCPVMYVLVQSEEIQDQLFMGKISKDEEKKLQSCCSSNADTYNSPYISIKKTKT